MKATPIAKYLEQKGRAGTVDWPAAPREPVAFKPKTALPAPEPAQRAGQPFRPSGLIAAVGARAGEGEPRPRAARPETETARRDSALLRRIDPPPGPDIETRLSEAYHRGVQEGLDAAREELLAARASERAEWQRRAVVERLDFQMNEFAKLSEAITTAFAEIERGIADRVARILQPLVTRAVSDRVVEELAREIARLRQAGRPGLIRIRGPEARLGELKQRIASLALDVEYTVDDAIEVVVEAGDTTIATGLQSWADLIGGLAARDEK